MKYFKRTAISTSKKEPYVMSSSAKVMDKRYKIACHIVPDSATVGLPTIYEADHHHPIQDASSEKDDKEQEQEQEQEEDKKEDIDEDAKLETMSDVIVTDPFLSSMVSNMAKTVLHEPTAIMLTNSSESVSELMADMLRVQQVAKDRIACGDFTIKEKVTIGKGGVRDVYFIGIAQDWTGFENCLNILKGLNEGFSTSNIVYVHALGNGRSIYCTCSGSFYECPSDLEYSGIPRLFKPCSGMTYAEIFLLERESKIAILERTRDRMLAKYLAGSAYIADYWQQYPNATYTEYCRTDLHDKPYCMGNMMSLPCIVFNDPFTGTRNCTPPILHAMRTGNGFIYILKNDAVMILDKQPRGVPMELDEPIQFLDILQKKR